MISCQELKVIMNDGLLSFPVTDFDANGDFNAKGYQARLEWLMPFGAQYVNDTQTACLLGSPQAISTMEYWNDLTTAKAIPTAASRIVRLLPIANAAPA